MTMRKFFLLLLTLSGWSITIAAQDQHPAPIGRMSPNAVKKTAENQATTWWLICKDTFLLNKSLIKIGVAPPLRHDARTGLTVLRANGSQISSLLSSNGLIRYVDKPRIPREEMAVVTFDATANQLNTIHHQLPSIDGHNLVLSLKERKPDSADIDFRRRFLSTPLADPELSTHASIMASMALGAGNSHYTGKGAAPAATLSASSFTNLLPETDADYQRYRISVQNHSYGTGIENYYGADALAYDASVIARPELVHVFSAGNNGTTTSDQGVYANIPGFANITGSFKMAKNIITVGAVDSFYNVASLSSRGPAYDGRLKPDLVAYGQDGSSGAAAIVSGIALLLQQAWQQSGMPALPPASLVKAALINSADDTGDDGPDYTSGYGNANAANAVLTMYNKRYFTGTVQEDQTATFNLNIGANIRQLKVTLCWTDPPAPPSAAKALLNDLDLSVQHIGSGLTTLPWIRSHAAHADSLKKPARQGIDTLNTTEQITINNPVTGDYSIKVRGNNAASFFSIAYQLDTADRFHWYAPTGSDALRGGASSVIRWSSTFAANTATLEYAAGDDNWHSIAVVDLHKKCYRWQVPAINAIVRLRITVGSTIFYSDAFVVSSRLTGFTAFNCPDSFAIGWNKSAGLQWQVYTLRENDQHLQPLADIVSDTTQVYLKQEQPQLYYAIAPLIGGKTGQKSFTFDYTKQGVACYIRNFLVSQETPRSAIIEAQLGSLHQVKTIWLEKIMQNGNDRLQQVIAPQNLNYEWRDDELIQGQNTYRLVIELSGGGIIYSDYQTLFALPDGNYLVWPNPAPVAGGVWIQAADFSPATIFLYNTMGQLISQSPLADYPQWLSLAGCRNGLYYLVIRKKGATVYKSALMVR